MQGVDGTGYPNGLGSGKLSALQCFLRRFWAEASFSKRFNKRKHSAL